MEIIRGKIPGAKKVVVYGPEGIGKSTFAAKFPSPLFIDTEGSTKDMDVSRTEAPNSWSMLIEQVRYIKNHAEICRSLIIDTADWAELLCSNSVCARYQKNSIEEFGYGKGYTYLQEEFGKLLNLLEEVVQSGIHVVLNAHAKMRKFEQPDEMGAYDRWEMKLSKQVAPLVKEWADMVLFCNYKTFVYNVDGQGAQKGKNKVQGGKRVMFTSHHPCWDAKNRYGLPDEMDFDYKGIAHIIEAPQNIPAPAVKTPVKESHMDEEIPSGKGNEEPEKKAQETPQPDIGREITSQGEAREETQEPFYIDDRVPQNLRELMQKNQVCEWDIQNVVFAKGYFPADTNIWDYQKEFVDGCLVAAWEQVYAAIKDMKEKEAVIFN